MWIGLFCFPNLRIVYNSIVDIDEKIPTISSLSALLSNALLIIASTHKQDVSIFRNDFHFGDASQHENHIYRFIMNSTSDIYIHFIMNIFWTWGACPAHCSLQNNISLLLFFILFMPLFFCLVKCILI